MKNLRTGLKDLVPSRIPVWYAALSASHGYLYSLRYYNVSECSKSTPVATPVKILVLYESLALQRL